MAPRNINTYARVQGISSSERREADESPIWNIGKASDPFGRIWWIR